MWFRGQRSGDMRVRIPQTGNNSNHSGKLDTWAGLRDTRVGWLRKPRAERFPIFGLLENEEPLRGIEDSGSTMGAPLRGLRMGTTSSSPTTVSASTAHPTKKSVNFSSLQGCYGLPEMGTASPLCIEYKVPECVDKWIEASSKLGVTWFLSFE